MVYSPEGYIKSWSIRKLTYLQAYLPSYLKATQKAYKKYYIDGFSWKGISITEDNKVIDGSPLIALKQNPSFSCCFLIEKDPANFEILKENVKPYKHARIFLGDCNDLIPIILKDINNHSPIFAFLDPTGLQLHWKTIETLGAKKTEIFFNFPYYMAFQRVLPNDPQKLSSYDKLSLCLPPGWENVYNECIAGRRQYLVSELLNLIETQLKNLGFVYIHFSHVIKSEQGNPLYYLIWAGKHKVGEKIIDHVLNKQFEEQLSFDFD